MRRSHPAFQASRRAGGVWLLMAAAAFGGSSTLELIESPVVDGPSIRLRELVRNPAELPAGWADRVVVESPAPGKAAEVTLPYLARALQKYPDMQDVVLRGQVQMTVKRTGSTISQERVLDKVRAYVLAHPRWKEAGAQVTCDPIASDVALSGSDADLAVASFATTGQPHRYVFHLSSPSGTETNALIPVHATVVPLQKVWVARKALPRGHVIAGDDLEQQALPPALGSECVPVDEELEGLELDRAVRVNEPLPRAAVMQPVCAERGDPVNVTITRGTLQVNLKARALATGRKGERILCLNENSKRRLTVKLTGAKEATVDI
jgi:flagella basal body P-ring formation protein FlgA